MNILHGGYSRVCIRYWMILTHAIYYLRTVAGGWSSHETEGHADVLPNANRFYCISSGNKGAQHQRGYL